ncbi:hypothetical protein ACWDRB_51175 [Nonomuraea sp. NPDC003707]
MQNVVLGGALAIVGSIVGTILVHFLQRSREKQARYFDQRKVAHIDFAQAFDRLRERVADSDYHGERPSDHDYRIYGDLPNLLTVVQVFAQQATYQAACKAMDQLKEWIASDGVADPALVDAAFDVYLQYVRKELGVA